MSRSNRIVELQRLRVFDDLDALDHAPEFGRSQSDETVLSIGHG